MPAQELAQLDKPPMLFTIIRWLLFSATVAIAIGMLALIDQHLLGLPWVYDGALTQYQGRQITISYCLLSPSRDSSKDANCNFALTAAALSLGLSLVWSYVQALSPNVTKHPKARFADLAICSLAVCWWLASGIALSAFTNQANTADLPSSDWRVGLCVLAWIQFLAFSGLTVMSCVLVAPGTRHKLFAKWAAAAAKKRENHKAAKAQKKLDKQQEKERAAAAQTGPGTHQAGDQPLAAAAPAQAAVGQQLPV